MIIVSSLRMQEILEQTDLIMYEEVEKILPKPERFDDDNHCDHLMIILENLHDQFKKKFYFFCFEWNMVEK